jgi:hypothetical protein
MPSGVKGARISLIGSKGSNTDEDDEDGAGAGDIFFRTNN